MHIAFTIPSWLLWTVGLLAAGFILGLAAMGALFAFSMRNFRLF